MAQIGLMSYFFNVIADERREREDTPGRPDATTICCEVPFKGKYLQSICDCLSGNLFLGSFYS